MIVSVIKSGMYTTIQDNGRIGQQDVGIPVGGAQDWLAYQQANMLVGNPDGTPALEATLIGPTLTFDTSCTIAITGAGMTPRLDRVAIPKNKTIQCPAGSQLSFAPERSGCRTYIAIAGEWRVEKWQGSVSPLLFGSKRWPASSVLRSVDTIQITSIAHSRISDLSIQQETQELDTISVLPGPEFNMIDRRDIARLFSQKYEVSNDSNRIGYRLIGQSIDLSALPPMISSPVIPGTVQITREGTPIVLLNDAQTIGGYPRVLQLTREALSHIAQKRPGDKIRFVLK